jgi:hypothetical protein
MDYLRRPGAHGAYEGWIRCQRCVDSRGSELLFWAACGTPAAATRIKSPRSRQDRKSGRSGASCPGHACVAGPIFLECRERGRPFNGIRARRYYTAGLCHVFWPTICTRSLPTICTRSLRSCRPTSHPRALERVAVLQICLQIISKTH